MMLLKSTIHLGQFNSAPRFSSYLSFPGFSNLLFPIKEMSTCYASATSWVLPNSGIFLIKAQSKEGCARCPAVSHSSCQLRGKQFQSGFFKVCKRYRMTSMNAILKNIVLQSSTWTMDIIRFLFRRYCKDALISGTVWHHEWRYCRNPEVFHELYMLILLCSHLWYFRQLLAF